MTEIDEVKKILAKHDERISELESLLKTKKVITSTDSSKSPPAAVLRLIIKNLNKLKLSELAIITLKFYENLTRDEIIKILKKWRKEGADSLSGGNFNRDLVRTGLVINAGKKGKETVHELTEDGKNEADKIIQVLQDKKGEN